ncbi:TetR/AcrR family transcriptional regulator [Naumannella cuiyingiana]|uniref:AcrR family transcriptional regulator n=1 Tax=Naumannella cuiyingiana TaxID=1347891 RepID=A0A7Z0IKX3_9ACTN|nr:TetR/AcrR family transcriptional regulator [Naumannella cuiyingiana]NYI70986.1 AcrR family transcriptional regulator [Naumannella cuiyingiana]
MPQAGESQISVRREQTRERLREAALEVFAERGILAGSVEEISERAGFTRGAFYSNYGSKDDLCLELLRGLVQTQVGTSLDAIARIGASAVSLDSVAEQAADVFALLQPQDRTRALFLAEIELYAARTPEFTQRYREHERELKGAFADVMRAAVDRVGLAWAVPEAEAAELLGTVHHQFVDTWLLTGEFDKQALERLLRPLLRALLVSR